MSERTTPPEPNRTSSPFGSGDVVFTFSYETYENALARGMMRPPDRILSSLLAHRDVASLLVANPFRSALAVALRTVRGTRLQLPEGARTRLVTPLRLRRSDPTDPRGIRDTYRRYGRELRRQSENLAQHTPDLITTSPLVAGFAPREWTGGSLYFGRDDWASSPARRAYWPAYREAYARIARSGMPVAAVSEQIIERIQPTGPYSVVPNGVEPTEWQGPIPAAPDWLVRTPQPRAVYVGTLDTRLDIEGLAALARARPELSIVLVGPIPDPDYLVPLRRYESIQVRESVGRVELVAVLRNAQLGLVAHRRTALTEAMSPLKVYEYLAAGLPVLSIDAPPIRDIDPAVVLTEHVADFVDVVDIALARGAAPEDERLRFIRDNSWAKRHAAMFQLLHDT